MDLSWFFLSCSKFRGTSVLWEKAFFCIFAWPHRENFQKIYNRTILKFDALHIAHIEADVPLFSKHLWKLAIRLKLWVLAHSEVSWSRTMTAKMSVFRPLFWRKSLFWPILTQKYFKCYTWLESYGSPLYDGKKKKIFFSPCEASEFWWRSGTDFLHDLRLRPMEE